MDQAQDQTSLTNAEETKTAEEAITETIDFYKQKYEEEKSLREKSEKEVVNLTRMLRNATIQPLATEEKPKSSEQLLDELFGEGENNVKKEN